jgi:hypothetical protein
LRIRGKVDSGSRWLERPCAHAAQREKRPATLKILRHADRLALTKVRSIERAEHNSIVDTLAKVAAGLNLRLSELYRRANL